MRYPAEVLSKREIAAMPDACGTGSYTGRRKRTLMYSAGSWLTEALALRPLTWTPSEGRSGCCGAEGPGPDRGDRPLGLAELARWSGEHREKNWTAGDMLFCTASGGPVTQAYVRRRLPELARAAGIHKRVHAIDLSVIRRQLGHSSLLTTERYLDHLEPESVVGCLQARTEVLIPVTGCGVKAKSRGQAG